MLSKKKQKKIKKPTKKGVPKKTKSTPSLAWDKGCGRPFCSHNAFSVRDID